MWNSLRGRFVVTSVVLLAVFSAMAFYASTVVSANRADSRDLIASYYRIHRHLEDAKDSLRQIEAGSYLLAAGNDSEGGKTVERALAPLPEIGESLWLDPLMATDGRRELAAAGGQALRQLSLLAETLRHMDRTQRLAMVKGEITPAIHAAYRIIHLTERQIYDSVLGQTFQSQDISEQVSRLVRSSIVLVCLMLAAGFLAFEFSIRRPLARVARAMDVEGNGFAPAQPLPETGPREIRTLVGAFEGMRRQIRSRQSRLESVLNNTSDGIITFDHDGRIQGFNAAAATLFGYDEGDAVGMRIAQLLVQDDERTTQAATTLLNGQSLGREQYLTAVRRDGMRFDLSCKVSAFAIDNLRLFNAVVADVSERKAMFDRLTYLAQHDPLTSLYNRRHFIEELARATERARRGKTVNAALLMIDLDHFKFVNDTLGHQAGDQLLIEVADRLRQRSREADLVARLGGDEFAILAFDVDTEGAAVIADSYNRQLADYTFQAKGRSVDIGGSIGVALLGPELGPGVDVLARADLACHVAKQQGRNRFHFYQPEDEQGTARLTTEIGYGKLLRDALAHGHLELNFQPIVELPSGQVRLYEVLVRLRNPDGSILPAGAFITEAERLGLATDIDVWVVRNTFAAIAAGQVPTGADRFSVNLSGRSIGDQRLSDAIAESLREHAVKPSNIVFEFTETAAFTSLAHAKEFILWLRGLGFQTALDDFGAGYSSFVYLRELVTDYVKLDGSLVRNIDSDPMNLAVVRAMSDVSRALGRRLIAEFVENADIAARLHEVGVILAQGYHFGRPEPWRGQRPDRAPALMPLMTAPSLA